MTHYSDHVNNFEPLNLQFCQIIKDFFILKVGIKMNYGHQLKSKLEDSLYKRFLYFRRKPLGDLVYKTAYIALYIPNVVAFITLEVT